MSAQESTRKRRWRRALAALAWVLLTAASDPSASRAQATPACDYGRPLHSEPVRYEAYPVRGSTPQEVQNSLRSGTKPPELQGYNGRYVYEPRFQFAVGARRMSTAGDAVEIDIADFCMRMSNTIHLPEFQDSTMAECFAPWLDKLHEHELEHYRLQRRKMAEVAGMVVDAYPFVSIPLRDLEGLTREQMAAHADHEIQNELDRLVRQHADAANRQLDARSGHGSEAIPFLPGDYCGQAPDIDVTATFYHRARASVVLARMGQDYDSCGWTRVLKVNVHWKGPYRHPPIRYTARVTSSVPVRPASQTRTFSEGYTDHVYVESRVNRYVYEDTKHPAIVTVTADFVGVDHSKTATVSVPAVIEWESMLTNRPEPECPAWAQDP